MKSLRRRRELTMLAVVHDDSVAVRELERLRDLGRGQEELAEERGVL